MLGHEPAGVVVATGEPLAARSRPGDRVFVHHHVPCGECEYCRRGHETLCDTFKSTRIEPGGFSELILVPAPNAALDTAPDPGRRQRRGGDGDRAARLLRPRPAPCARGGGTRLLVIGGGQMGLLTAAAALAAGAEVTVAEPLRPARLSPRTGARARRPGEVEAGAHEAVMLATGAARPGSSRCAPPARAA